MVHMRGPERCIENRTQRGHGFEQHPRVETTAHGHPVTPGFRQVAHDRQQPLG